MRHLSIMVALVAGLALVGAGCGAEYTISEDDGVDLMAAALAARGYTPAQTDYVIDDVTVCPEGEACRAPQSIALDGWDPVARVGFEYLAEGDADQPVAVSYVQADDEAALLQAAVNEALGDDGTVVIMRWWQHETRSLAERQFGRALQVELDALGL